MSEYPLTPEVGDTIGQQINNSGTVIPEWTEKVVYLSVFSCWLTIRHIMTTAQRLWASAI